MPKITRATDEERKLTNDLIKRYGFGMLSYSDIAREIHASSIPTARKFMSGVPAYFPTGRPRFRAVDVAKKILESKYSEAAT